MKIQHINFNYQFWQYTHAKYFLVNELNIRGLHHAEVLSDISDTSSEKVLLLSEVSDSYSEKVEWQSKVQDSFSKKVKWQSEM